MPTVDVITVNWNAGDQLRACLESVARGQRQAHALERVVVVDNASSDGSAGDLEIDALPLTIYRNQTNRGFAAACNQGAAGSTADYLLFLNPDTEVGADAIDRCVAHLEAPGNERAGLLGPQLLDEEGHVARSCARRPSLINLVWPMTGLDRVSPSRFPGVIRADWDHGQTATVEHVMGAFFLTRRSTFEELGGFDERYFVYLEDLDYAARACDAGWEVRYLADVQIFHRGCGTSEQARAQRLAYALDSRVRFAYRHLPPPAAHAHLAATYGLELPVRLARALATRHGAGETLRGYRILTKMLQERPLTPNGARP